MYLAIHAVVDWKGLINQVAIDRNNVRLGGRAVGNGRKKSETNDLEAAMGQRQRRYWRACRVIGSQTICFGIPRPEREGDIWDIGRVENRLID